MTHSISQWLNCYPSNWKGVIVPEAMAHPAKYSSKLIRRIYEHILEQGWVKEGDRVLDPFGGVALGALDAMRLGLDWTGVELEVKFQQLGMVNIVRWMNQFGDMPRWGRARLFNGDSRRLLEVIGGQVQVSLSSPPYAEALSNPSKEVEFTGNGGAIHPRNYGETDGNLGNMRDSGFSAAVSSPPYAESIQTNEKGSGIDYSKSKSGGKGRTAGREAIATGYGRSDGQLGAMKAQGFDAAISSPPFLQSEGGTPEPKPGGTIDERLYARHAAGNKSANGYGVSDGQLSSMRDGGFDAAVSSPPYVSGGHHADQTGAYNTNGRGQGQTRDTAGYGRTDGQLGQMNPEGFDMAISSPPYEDSDQNYKAGWERFHKTREPLNKNDIQREAEYGATPGQLSVSDDFWLAARTIVEQVYLALEPGGHACWVVKDYVKNKQIVPFCDQWRQLCESVGFVTLHEHHAMLVHHKGSQHTLEGGLVEKKTESKSFFRRLAEKNGSPRIDYETVYCMVKS